MLRPHWWDATGTTGAIAPPFISWPKFNLVVTAHAAIIKLLPACLLMAACHLVTTAMPAAILCKYRYFVNTRTQSRCPPYLLSWQAVGFSFHVGSDLPLARNSEFFTAVETAASTAGGGVKV